ncbi:hypothetical protein [Legionella maioricensis]|uniref:Uncharacterized protein n=1 Tax=Legionella maioricensis TaxID=2896528 RepID=A0A9X2D2N4_9GAMM|nr:hypothetical protein [Legionella maioricensis]MCL9685348.1 hypothetical protein [Legionella maioricensis]MCL9688690.1 hypothetical protein [Legionella maioricensis]
MAKEHLLLLSKLLTEYHLEIPFARGMSEEIEKLLTHEKINFDLILAFAIRYPVTNLIPYFVVMKKEDVDCLILCVRNIFQQAVAERMNELESMDSFSLALLSADLSHNKELLRTQILQLDVEELDKDRERILAEIYESSYSLLATGHAKKTMQFSRITSMRVPIDKVMDNMLVQFAKYNTYYEDASIKTSIEQSDKRFDYIAVGTDQSVQYHPASSSYYRLHPPVSTLETDSPWNSAKKEVEGFEPKLISVRITNCHSVFIHDIETNRFWLLHVSPGSMTGLNPIASYPVKNAYIDLQQNYLDKNLGVDQNAKLEVVVVDKRGHFDEDLLRRRLPGTITSLKIIKPTIELPNIIPAGEEKPYMYHVCLNPKQNLLAIKQNEHYLEYPNVFDSLSLENSIVDNYRDEIRFATLAQKLGINSERERVRLLKEINIGADSVEKREMQIANM